MDDNKLLDFFKNFDPNVLRMLENLNITKIIKQLEQLKLTGVLERLEDLNKLNVLLKQMEDIKLSELVKRVEDIKLSNILKQIEDNKLLEMLPVPLKNLKEGTEIKNVTIEHKQESIPEQLKKLAELRDVGILTNDEFQLKKKQLLDKM